MQSLFERSNILNSRKANLKTSLAAAVLTLTSVGASADVMLGAYLPNDGFSRQIIADFNNVTPKNLAYVNVFSAFSHDWDNLYWQSKNVVAEGAYPMISWMPIDLSRRDDNLLPEIAIGLWDDYLTQWGTKLLAWVNSYPAGEKPRVSIRFAHEFNGNWYPYSNTPESYKAAWQHIHGMFDAMGVNQHVDWVWNASKTNVDDYSDFTVYYPGDNYVDWTSLDGYNWGSNYSPNGWSSFKEVFANAYNILVDNYPSKPIMIAETGSAEPSDIPNTAYGMYGDNSDALESKSDWISGMLTDIEVEFPAVRAISMFNVNKELGWSITEEINTGMDSWIAGTQSTHYTSDYLIASNGNIDIPVVDSPELFADAMEVMVESPVLLSESQTTEPASKGRGGKKAQKADTKRTNPVPSGASTMSEADYRLDVVNNRGNSLNKSKRIDAKAQIKLAKSKKPKKVKEDKDKAYAKALRELNKAERKELKRKKLSVIDY